MENKENQQASVVYDVNSSVKNQKKKAKSHRVNCSYCGKGYLARRKDKKFCSSKCNSKSWRERKDVEKVKYDKIEAKKQSVAKNIGKGVLFNPIYDSQAGKNKHLVYAIVDTYHAATAISKLCKALSPNADVKTIKL